VAGDVFGVIRCTGKRKRAGGTCGVWRGIATLMTVAVYLFLRHFRPRFQLDGALMTASAAGVIGFARAASMDMPLAAMFTIALLGWYGWYES